MKSKPQLTLVMGVILAFLTLIPNTGFAELNAPAATAEDNNPLAILIEPKSFIGTSWWQQSAFWYSPSSTLFEKRVFDWTEQDFQMLEQKFKEQIDLERKEIIDRNLRGKDVSAPEQDAVYMSRKQYLNEAISSIPKFKLWTAAGRKKEQELADNLASIKKQDEEQQLLRQQQDQEARAEENKQLQEEKLSSQQREQEMRAQATTAAVEYKSDEEKKNNLSLFFGVIVAAAAGWIWNKFIRLRCPRCKSTNPNVLSISEIDRWRGTKKVVDTHSRGRNTRHVSTTYVKNQYHYKCRDCNHEWQITKKEEL